MQGGAFVYSFSLLFALAINKEAPVVDILESSMGEGDGSLVSLDLSKIGNWRRFIIFSIIQGRIMEEGCAFGRIFGV